MFTGVAVDAVPSPPQRFDIFVALTDGLGDVTMTLSVVHLETNEEVYSQKLTVRFPDPLQIVNLCFRIRKLIYESLGSYLFVLTADDQELAARRVRVYM